MAYANTLCIIAALTGTRREQRK